MNPKLQKIGLKDIVVELKKKFDNKEKFEKRFGGVLYIFLRGMLQREGVFFFRPGWNDLLDYERMLSLEKY